MRNTLVYGERHLYVIQHTECIHMQSCTHKHVHVVSPLCFASFACRAVFVLYALSLGNVSVQYDASNADAVKIKIFCRFIL